MVESGTALGVALSLIGGLTWLLRLEGRVNTQAERHKDLKEGVDYIRARIDRALNGHGDRDD